MPETKNFNNVKVHPKQKSTRKKILFIDEVDVFFQDNFYGNQYRPVASLKDKTINNLNKYIWDNRKDISYRKVRNSTQYQKCCIRFFGWNSLIDEVCKDMVDGVKNYDDHYPVVKDGKIGYKENDGISYKTRYGYKTQFKAREQYELGNISSNTLEQDYLAIYLSSGQFSYAEIPKKIRKHPRSHRYLRDLK